jgi:hypothetical protein
MKRTLGLSLGVATIGTLALAALVTGSGGDLGRQARITNDQAIAAVLKAAPEARNPRAAATSDTATSRAIEVLADNVTAEVDAATGSIGNLVPHDMAPGSNSVRVTMEAAKSSAESFAKGAGVSIPEAVTQAAEMLDHGSSNEYVVRWTKLVDGIRVPDFLTVRVNPATGEVFALVRVQRAYEAPAAPNLSKDEAGAVALSRVANAAAVEAADLAVVFDGAGAQRTVWQVSVRVEVLEGYHAVDFLWVDAISGEPVPFPPASH